MISELTTFLVNDHTEMHAEKRAEVTTLRCGAKCFQVEMELDGKREVKSVDARTPAKARKAIRKVYGEHTPVISVRQRKSHR